MPIPTDFAMWLAHTRSIEKKTKPAKSPMKVVRGRTRLTARSEKRSKD